MSLLGDIAGSINPFSSESKRYETINNLKNRINEVRYNFLDTFGSDDAIAEMKFKAWQHAAKLMNLDQTVKMQDHYFDKTGKTYDYSINDLRKFTKIKDAEKINQDRLFGSLKKAGTLFLKTKSNTLKPIKIHELKDNDRIILQDYYDVDTPFGTKLLIDDPDLSLSLGSFKVRSQSNLEFVKSKDKLLPYGQVKHSIHDVYDFNKKPYKEMGELVEQSGRAKQFNTKIEWQTQPIGVIKIKDDDLDFTGVEWFNSQ